MAAEASLKVEGMTCTGCENAMGRALRRLAGVIRVEADHRRRVALRFDPVEVSQEQIKDRIRAAGYECP